MTQKHFAELIEVSQVKEKVLKAIADEFNPSFKLNKITLLTSETILPLLKDEKLPFPRGYSLHELLSMIQKVIKEENSSFKVDGKWADLIKVSSMTNPYEEIARFSEEAEIEHLISFLDAQKDSEQMWKVVVDELSRLFEQPLERNAIADISLASIPQENIFQVIAAHLAKTGQQVVIPEDVKPFLSWNDSASSTEEFWELKGNENLYEVNWFKECVQPVKLIPQNEKALENFKAALPKIEQFAADNRSGFALSFRIAKWIIEKPDSYFERKDSVIDQHMSDLAKDGYSEQLQEAYASKFENLLYSTEGYGTNSQVKHLLALEFADVFGGMGTWNDQGLDRAEGYQSVTTEMYQAVQDLRVKAINNV